MIFFSNSLHFHFSSSQIALRSGTSTKLDDRLYEMCELKSLPLRHLMTKLYPDLYAIHTLSDKGALNIDDQVCYFRSYNGILG